MLLPVAAVAQALIESGVSIKTSVREVMVDVTVRDKHGKIVKDLKLEDVSIYEDGVRQDVPGQPGSYEMKIATLQGSESNEQSIHYWQIAALWRRITLNRIIRAGA